MAHGCGYEDTMNKQTSPLKSKGHPGDDKKGHGHKGQSYKKGDLLDEDLSDEYSDFNTAIEASRSDKGDFDVNTGVYRANTLGYGDGPRGQIAQMGAETGSKPAPDYTYLKQFLDASIVSYDPSFLMTQARDGEEIDADMELIKQLMAAGADFEII